MLREIHFLNAQNDVFYLSLDPFGSRPSEYVIRDIQGLGPTSAEIITSTYATMDGGVYQASRAGERNLVITLGYNPSYESADPFGELRRGLYPHFTPKTPLTMLFYTEGGNPLYLNGVVESMDPTLFSADPEVQISIVCPDPYFYGETIPVSRVGSGTFEVYNPGAETGFVAVLQKFRSETNYPFTLYRNSSPIDSMALMNPFWLQGELGVIEFSTVKGNKYAEFKLQSEYLVGETSGNIPFVTDFGGTSILGGMSGWLQIMPGLNRLELQILGDTTATAEFELRFRARYVGI